MEVTGSSEVGISPVLLQAINQLQRSKQSQAVSGLSIGQQVVLAGGDGNTAKVIKVEGASQPQATIIQQASAMKPHQTVSNTPVVALQPRIIQTSSGQKIIIVQGPGDGGESPGVINLGGTNSLVHTVVQPEPKKVIVKSISGNVVNIGGSKMVLSRDHGQVQQSTVTSIPQLPESQQNNSQKVNYTNVQMGNVLSAIASRVKNQKPAPKTVSGVTVGQLPNLPPQRIVLGQGSSSINTSSINTDSAVTEVFVQSPPIQQVQSPPPMKKIKLSPQSEPRTLEVIAPGSSEVPTPLTVVKTMPPLSVAEQPSFGSIIKPITSKLETVSAVEDYSSPVTIVNSPAASSLEPATRVIDYPVQLQDGTQVILQQIEPVETTVETVAEANEEPSVSQFQIVMNSSASVEPPGQPCPICGDRISGYHYGIFTCESCKGFFKRTVQNKKAFICHRKGECDINIVNRKKCPSCRFKRCLLSGMRLEAVREDRQRGGRSSYEGAMQYAGKPKTPSTVTPKRLVVRSSQPSVRRTIVLPSDGQTYVYKQSETGGVVRGAAPIQPYTPQVLEDLLAVESLMAENEDEQECCLGKFQDGDDNMFSSLLHFADHCLYKIVRWARNLPDFANVSTDDQILLLQNSWGELLCMCCCWNSIHHEDMLKLAHGRMLDLHRAQEMDILDVTQKLINFTSHLRNLELDLHEYVALKVMLLLNPDVKNLQDGVQIRQHQESVCEYLMLYTATHYPDKSAKFCQLLARLPELTRSCIQAKDILKQRQGLGDIPQYSLLSELLKGDAVVQST